MALKTYKFDEELIFNELTHLHKDGYCNIKAMPVFLFNEYRELGIVKCTEIVNKWIDNNKIKHERICCILDKYDESHIFTFSELTNLLVGGNYIITDNGHIRIKKEAVK